MTLVGALLGFIGLVFVFAEFFFPSVFLGTMGGLFLLGAFFYFYQTYLFTVPFFFLLASTFLALFGVVYLAAKILRKKIFLKDAEKQEITSFFLIGKEGVAISDLRPMGKVKVDNTVYSVSSDVFIPRGKTVRIIEESLDKIKVEEKV